MTTKLKTTTLKLDEKATADILYMLKRYGQVRVLGLGSFTVRKIPAKKMYNSIVGKDITVKARKRIGFKAFTKVAELINEK
jgi:nucleoid DNA-binding protein